MENNTHPFLERNEPVLQLIEELRIESKTVMS